MKRLTAFICTLLLATAMGFTQTKTIHVTPDKAKIFVDGSEVGNGSYTLRFNMKTDFYMLKFECPGYITKQVKLFKNNPNKTIAYKLAKDEAFMNSIGPSGNAGGEEAIDLAKVILNDGSPYPKYIILSEIKGIELPSDEEIEKYASNYAADGAIINGAKWMKEQILNQNK